MISIRDAQASDETRWRELWKGYIAFYNASVSEEITAATWARTLDPNSSLYTRVAVLENSNIVGFTNRVLHPTTWTQAPSCYLEDLFVDSKERGQGVGRALLDDLIELSNQNNWARLYWHTQASNTTARKLYDRYGSADDFVRYRLVFEN